MGLSSAAVLRLSVPSGQVIPGTAGIAASWN
jgi:hypothetical protein